ncbi:MAG: hypothetical protein HY537_02880 [Deltaproteobacteria bacterium]|nr:hypothetical protein [Deltaproteobacteria bacterium]
MKLNSLVVFVMFSASLVASASSLECSDFGGSKLQYKLITKDGGAGLLPREYLTLNGEVLIKRDGYEADSNIKKAFFGILESASKTLLETETKDKNFALTAFVTKVTIYGLAGDEQPQPVLYEGLVSCQRARYKGIPIP